MKGFPSVDINFKNLRLSKIVAHCFWQILRILLLTSHAKAHSPTLSQALASPIKLNTSWRRNNKEKDTQYMESRLCHPGTEEPLKYARSQ